MFQSYFESFIARGMAMKRMLIGGAVVASMLATTGAYAADLAPRPYTKAPIIVDPGYNWTGFYAGLNIGYSWGRSSTTESFRDALTGTILNANAVKFDMNGVIGGGQIGYNWQQSNWVFGLEADIQGSGEKGNTNAVCPGNTTVFTPPGATSTVAAVSSACSLGHAGDTNIGNVNGQAVTNALSEKIEWFGTFRGRIGPTITPTILAYVTGGLAYGSVKATDTVNGTNVTNPGGQGVNGGTILTPVAATFGNSSTRVGWTVGAGVEGVITGNWTAKLEYLYMDLGHVSGSFVTPVVGPSGAFVVASYNSHITDNILRVGVNYKWGGPVVAKY
jgi:outer membrane immunogenic protein